MNISVSRRGGAMAGQFRGDVTPTATWLALKETPQAVLVDVRTSAEWAYVGGPDLSSLKRSVIQIEWQEYPFGNRNPKFAEEVAAQGVRPETPTYLICRSGVRSRAAAVALAELGYTTYNVADGFEGQIDGAGHRGVLNGWKVIGLPWTQT
jgi:rhodanese-related sulfurtransferase